MTLIQRGFQMNILITLRAVRQETIFPYAQDYLKFLEILIDAKKAHASSLFAFSLMPDYCQMVIECVHEKQSVEFMSCLTKNYEDHLFVSYARQTVWKRGCGKTILRNSKELLDAVKKVEFAPVLAGLADFSAQYPYGSAYHRGCRTHVLEKVI